MPKVTKVKMPATTQSSRPQAAAPARDQPEKYYCCRCTRSFKAQKTNFNPTRSPLFKENNGYLPVCKHCINDLYDHYKEVLGSDREATRRICLKFDYYWSGDVFDMTQRSTLNSSSRMSNYLSKISLNPNTDKTYDDTIDEEAAANQLAAVEGKYRTEKDGDEGNSSSFLITDDMINFWGDGLNPSYYPELERRWANWCVDSYNDTDMSPSEKALIKQICILEVTINRDSASGKSIDKSVNALNSLLGSANLKPVQRQKEDAADNISEMTPFGVWIRKIEDTDPISEPDPAFKDVDGIIKYITVWFFGHLCRMLKLDNKYARLYDAEIERLKVERPEYEGEDEDYIYDDIFDRARAKEEEIEQGGASG